ncbi:MAG: hypothetical protein ABR981_05115 [Candidatus Micrarchaeaceae archaeon]|jgi:hypothetical protein
MATMSTGLTDMRQKIDAAEAILRSKDSKPDQVSTSRGIFVQILGKMNNSLSSYAATKISKMLLNKDMLIFDRAKEIFYNIREGTEIGRANASLILWVLPIEVKDMLPDLNVPIITESDLLRDSE